MSPAYIETVRLLLAVAPVVFHDSPFALKGGTAINLFVRDLPRLSVDLDLVVRDHTLDRDQAFAVIASALEASRAKLVSLGYQCELGKTQQQNEVKLYIQKNQTRIKIEVNHVARGSALPIEMCPLAPQAQEVFQTDLSLPLLHQDELYGSKLVAALDRQHPRDLFDVLGLFENGGITSGIIECFVYYLSGHNRPLHEVLFARPCDLAGAFENEFKGMSRSPVTLVTLTDVRQRLFTELPAKLTDRHCGFLISLAHAQPDWSLLACPHLDQLPAIQWKLMNLRKLKRSNPRKFQMQADELEQKLANRTT